MKECFGIDLTAAASDAVPRAAGSPPPAGSGPGRARPKRSPNQLSKDKHEVRRYIRRVVFERGWLQHVLRRYVRRYIRRVVFERGWLQHVLRQLEPVLRQHGKALPRRVARAWYRYNGTFRYQ